MNVIASHEYIEHVHSGEEEVKERTIGRRRRVVIRVQWVEETERRVRNSLLFLILSLSTPLYRPPWCRSDCQMDPGELCCCSTMNSTSMCFSVAFGAWEWFTRLKAGENKINLFFTG